MGQSRRKFACAYIMHSARCDCTRGRDDRRGIPTLNPRNALGPMLGGLTCSSPAPGLPIFSIVVPSHVSTSSVYAYAQQVGCSNPQCARFAAVNTGPAAAGTARPNHEDLVTSSCCWCVLPIASRHPGGGNQCSAGHLARYVHGVEWPDGESRHGCAGRCWRASNGSTARVACRDAGCASSRSTMVTNLRARRRTCAN